MEPDTPIDKNASSARRRTARIAEWVFVIVFLGGGTLVLDRYVKPRVYRVNLDDPRVQLPVVQEIVPTYALAALALLSSAATFCAFEFVLLKRPKLFFAALSTFALGFAEACGFTLVLTNVLKLVVGRPRPFFKEVCGEFVDATSGLCTGVKGVVDGISDARKSFPSGHSSLSFACFVYLALYMALKMNLSNPNTSLKSFKLLLLVVPIATAAFVAASRIIDFHHNYDDVLAGSVLGAGIAVAVWWSRWKEVDRHGAAAEEQESPGVLPIVNDQQPYTATAMSYPR